MTKLTPGDHVTHDYHPRWKGEVVAVNPAPAPGEQEALVHWTKIGGDADNETAKIEFDRFRGLAWHARDAIMFAGVVYADPDGRCLVHPALVLTKVSIVDLIGALDA